MSPEERNMHLMQTLDDAWNAQDLDTFAQRHKPDVVVRWPGKPPTSGVEAIDFFTAFPDQHVENRPYRVLFASGDWTCSVGRFSGTMIGPMKGPDGNVSTMCHNVSCLFTVDEHTSCNVLFATSYERKRDKT
jgi:SnoaL-like polyketide cyclase